MPEDVQPESPTWGSPEWAEAYKTEHGMYPMAGGDGEGDAAPPVGEDAPDGGEGQGVEDGTGGLYDLSSVPEDLRQFVEPHLKAMEGNVTRRFQQHKEAMDAWTPYEELGIQDVDPGQLRQLLDFAELAQDQEAFAEWWKSVGERLELFPKEDVPPDELESLFDEDLTPEKIKELVSEAIAERVDPLYERFDSTEAQRVEQEAMADIQAQLAQIKSEHGEDVDTDAILKLAFAYSDTDPDNAIQLGLQDYLKLVGKGEAGLFAEKAGQPKPPEGEGAADTRPEPILTFADAKKAAAERLRAANTA